MSHFFCWCLKSSGQPVWKRKGRRRKAWKGNVCNVHILCITSSPPKSLQMSESAGMIKRWTAFQMSLWGRWYPHEGPPLSRPCVRFSERVDLLSSSLTSVLGTGNFSCIPQMDFFFSLSPVLLSVTSFQVSPILSQFLIILLVYAAFPWPHQLCLPYQTESILECSPQQRSPQVKITDITMTACQIFVQLLCIIYIRLHFWNALLPRSRARLIYLTSSITIISQLHAPTFLLYCFIFFLSFIHFNPHSSFFFPSKRFINKVITVYIGGFATKEAGIMESFPAFMSQTNNH